MCVSSLRLADLKVHVERDFRVALQKKGDRVSQSVLDMLSTTLVGVLPMCRKAL